MDKKDFEELFNQTRRDKAYVYHNRKNKLVLTNNIVKLALVFFFFYYDLEKRLFDFINNDYWFSIKLLFFLFIILFIFYILSTYIEYFSIYQLRRKYNLSAQSTKDWLQDKVKSFLLTFVLTYGFSVLFLYLTSNYPNNWWIFITIILSIFIILLNYLLPVLILPLFYSLKSYPEGELKDRLMKTFDKLDVEIEDIYEINLSSKITSANAAVIGMGNTRKILLSDNLKDRFSDDEIEAILCHEIGHHVNNDIYKNLFMEPIIIAITSFIVYQSWPYLLDLFGYLEMNPIVTLPALFILWGILYAIFTPLQLYLSRKYEIRADQFAFEIIDDPMDLGRAFAKLADDSLSRLEYSWWEKIYKASHPSIKSRIYEAKDFKNDETT